MQKFKQNSLNNNYKNLQRRRTDLSNSDIENAKSIGQKGFLNLFKDIIVKDPTPIQFDGALNENHMQAIWTWIIRDVFPDLAQFLAKIDNEEKAKKIILSNIDDIRKKVSQQFENAVVAGESDHKLAGQLGGEEIKERVPIFISAMRYQPVLSKASAFGKAANMMEDELALGKALQSMPLKDEKLASLLFQAVISQITNPGRLILSATNIVGASSEAAFVRAGFGPLIEALLSHAQNQASILTSQKGIFIDADLMCNSINRFHKLFHAATGYIELDRDSRLCRAASEISRQMAKIVEPRLEEVSTDVSQSLRKPRRGLDRLDSDRLLAALNGIYLLDAVREARESLALNALFKKIWRETGQSLEILLERNLEELKQDNNNEILSQRLDMGIKMARVRFGPDYADALQKAKDKIMRRKNLN